VQLAGHSGSERTGPMVIDNIEIAVGEALQMIPGREAIDGLALLGEIRGPGLNIEQKLDA
jgi:hypothetical protein